MSNDTALSTPEALAEATRLVSGIRNSDVVWKFDNDNPVEKRPVRFELSPRNTSIEQMFPRRFDPSSVKTRACVLALLSALEDPDRKIAAHAVLTFYIKVHLVSVRTDFYHPDPQANGRWYFGLLIQRPPGDPTPRAMPAASPDLVQEWHDVLDQRIVSIWYGTLVQCTGILPMFWLTKPRFSRKRVRRWIFNTAALVSSGLLLAVLAATFLDGHGEWSAMSLFYGHRAGQPTEIRLLVDWDKGSISVGEMEGRIATGEFAETHDIQCRSLSLMKYLQNRNTIVHLNDGSEDSSGFAIRLPYQLVGVMLSALPGLWLFRAVVRTRHRPGTCLVCGYDLRATPDRCPECGALA